MLNSIQAATSFINPFAANESILEKKQKSDILIEVGSSNVLVDGIRNFLSIPVKLILWDSKVNSGNVSQETIEKMRDFLDEKGLHDVNVSVNQYKPQLVWQRTFTNPKTSFLSKCTVGLATCLMETLAIPKLTGLGDHYNPSSNTVHLFSNDTAIALHECGHAEDFNNRLNPILYGIAGRLPYIGMPCTLYHEFTATSNACTYLANRSLKDLKQAFTLLTPAFATYCAAAICTPPNVMEIMDYASHCSEPQWDFGEKACNDFKSDALKSTITFISVIAIGHVIGRILAARVNLSPKIDSSIDHPKSISVSTNKDDVQLGPILHEAALAS